ncbi:tetratricopeptide repeat protein [Legionella erythra]|uniref:tetratricopeptide repeat protein n=1 Tax=Legionella erythra TaxID=448 RepID=UPI0010415DB2|nr:tetratricopeptide repeat protein [Legionella erythra]
MRFVLFFILWLSSAMAHAFGWQDLWATDDQQAQALMNKGQYKKAQERFQQPDWQAAAAYRAGDYEQAANHFGALETQQGYYNQGNALAHMGRYEDAIKAYDEALRINPNDKDALHNRQLVENLLKKDENKQQNQDQNNQNQQQNQGQQGNNQQDQQQNQGQQGNNQQDQQQNNNQQGDNQQTRQGKASKQNSATQAQQNKNKRMDESPGQSEVQNQQSAENREKQQAKEQMLNLIPDDPGGLMREKFLRDHLKRKRGWYQ